MFIGWFFYTFVFQPLKVNIFPLVVCNCLKIAPKDLDNSKFTKGQLISEVLFGVIVSTKKPTNFFKDFCPSL